MSVKIKVRNGNKQVTYKSLREAATKTKIDYMVLYMRLRAGKGITKAISTPVRKYSKAA